uniref:Ribonuclease H-like domain-containing protein n=1 Tax=Tanacetum cinerariifolium TaxID=118510 RepID=A0A6L2L1C2_TANCI|nr:ribonuclease H-like domain-containing protein [Tanacetum cinerariifolium]
MDPQSETTQTLSALKLPLLKTGDYDPWSMRIEQYLTHTDYALWEVIVNGDAPVAASASAKGPIPPKTVEQRLARKNELKAKNTMLLAIPDEHLLKFHGIIDAKSLWQAIKTRFGDNKELKKMQKTIMKQQYKNFTASKYEGLDKTYESLPSAWNTHTLIMRNKVDLDTLSMDDLYKNLKGQASSSTYADDVMFSLFVNQSNSPQLDNEDLEQIDTDDLEEMDLRWQVAMLTMKSYQGEEGPTDFALMAYSFSLSSSNTEKIAFLKYDVQVKDIFIKKLKNQLEEALKEKDDLKLKLEKFETSSKNLSDLLNSQISVNNKTGIGFGSQINENEIHINKSKVFESASDSSVNESEEDIYQINDRFKKVEGYHAVPPLYTGNFKPSRAYLSFAGLDGSVYKSKVSETNTSKDSLQTTASETSKDGLEKSKTIRPSAPIIED